MFHLPLGSEKLMPLAEQAAMSFAVWEKVMPSAAVMVLFGNKRGRDIIPAQKEN